MRFGLQWRRREGPIPADGRKDDPLNRWLTTRLASQVSEKSASAPPRPAEPVPTKASRRKDVKLPPSVPKPPPPEDDEAATRPGAPLRSSTPLHGSMVGLLGPARSTRALDDDPATVLANRRAVTSALANLDDPVTVQRARVPRPPGSAGAFPVAFIGESVMDPETVFDQGVNTAHWDDQLPDQHHDEVPPGPLPSAVHDRSNPTLAREAFSPPAWASRGESDEPADHRMAVLLPILAGALGGVVIVAIVMAWFAGSP